MGAEGGGDGEDGCQCRPLGLLIGLPFAALALVLSLVGAVVWILGSALSCLCPCCVCCAAAANLAVSLIQMPVKVIRWFIRQIPC
ncbi:signaling peptide TAXIMIN 2-like [Lolium rigidum]|uniref:signaling peptide TAXIMIN 2-like n=1 Tax=Lolium rigidum TaxID=89674 RepID=UPI001F5D6815|nr:signaling peptide TAXIMIN 2-like [Lolium rigidum]